MNKQSTSAIDPTHFEQFDTEKIKQRDKAHFLHPFQLFDVFEDEGALPIAAAHDAYIYDSDGNQYLDAVGGLWCTNIGLGREEMAEAIADQVRAMAYASPFVDMTNVPATELSTKLAQLAPGDLNHVSLSCGGSTAIDTAFRLIQYYQNCRGLHQKKHMISRVNSYHGTTYASMSIGGKPGDHPPEFDYMSDTVHHISCPNYYRAPEDMTESDFLEEKLAELENKILELGADKVAAFFAEPIFGAGGVIVPPDTYWPEIQRICNKYNILLIADEVICGFGRTGNWFGSQTVGWAPDIMTIAKGLSSGYQPIGGSIVSDKIAGVMAACEFNHGYTYNAHPVAAAVALENLTIMQEEKLVDYVSSDIGPYLKQQWEALVDHPMVGEAKIVGMMGSIALTPHKESRAKFAAEAGTVGYMVRERCFANNLVMRHVYDRMIISPPLVITRDEVDILIARARQSLDEAMAQVKEAGLWQAAS